MRNEALSRLSACRTPFPNLLITHDRKRDCGTGKGSLLLLRGEAKALRASTVQSSRALPEPFVRPDGATAYGAVRVPRKNYLWHCFGARLGCHKISQCARGRARGLCVFETVHRVQPADRAPRQSRRRRHKSLGTC